MAWKKARGFVRKRWVAALGSLFVLAGFVVQKGLVDRSNDARQELETVNQADTLEGLSLQSSAYDVSQENIGILKQIESTGINMTLVYAMDSGEFSLMSDLKRAADSVLDKLPNRVQELSLQRETLGKEIAYVKGRFRNYLATPYVGPPAELVSVEQNYRYLQELVRNTEAYNNKVQTEAERQIKEQQTKLDHRTDAEYTPFGLGWVFSTFRKLGGKDDAGGGEESE